jgi:hypothetical protein
MSPLGHFYLDNSAESFEIERHHSDAENFTST